MNERARLPIGPWILLAACVAGGLMLSVEEERIAEAPPESFVSRWLIEPWQAIHREGAAERAPLGEEFDARALWVLPLAALMMTFHRYYGQGVSFREFFPTAAASEYGNLLESAWWTGSQVLVYLLIPLVAMLLAGFSWRDTGLDVRGIGTHLWIYGALFLAVVPAVVAVSYTKSFQATYPFYKQATRSWFDLIAWELLYALSFLALEFFFRGFLLNALRRPLGANAIFVMLVPYCMIHFGKPVAETVGAIVAGIALGTLALYTRSIWCGVMIHVSVAVLMDMLCLWHARAFPGMRQ